MIDYKWIIPECHADTAVVECLGFSNPNHQHGKGNVKAEIKTKFKGEKAVGIIDFDKDVYKVIDAKIDLKESETLFLKQDIGTKHYFIFIKDKLEKFLLKTAKESGIDTSKYKIPNDFMKLGYLIKTTEIDSNPDFRRFLKALIREKAEPMVTLKAWLDELANN